MKRSKNLVPVEHSSELLPSLLAGFDSKPKDIILSFDDSYSSWITSLKLYLLGNKAIFKTKSGETYLVDKIPSDVLINWAEASSKGRFFNNVVKPNNQIYKAV